MLAEINPLCEDIIVCWVRGQEARRSGGLLVMASDASEPRLQSITATDVLMRQSERSSR